MIIWFSIFSVNAMNYVTLLSFWMLNQLCNLGYISIGLDVLFLKKYISYCFFELLLFLLGFLMYIHGRHWPVIFYFESPSQILLKKLSCLRNESGNAPSFSIKKFVQVWCFSSLNILENSGVEPLDWSVLCGKVCFFNCRYNLFIYFLIFLKLVGG